MGLLVVQSLFEVFCYRMTKREASLEAISAAQRATQTLRLTLSTREVECVSWLVGCGQLQEHMFINAKNYWK